MEDNLPSESFLSTKSGLACSDWSSSLGLSFSDWPVSSLELNFFEGVGESRPGCEGEVEGARLRLRPARGGGEG